MMTRKQSINRKIAILISVLLLQSVATSINASNHNFSGESFFSNPPDNVDLTPWTIDCYDDFEAIWIWQSNDQPIGISPPADSNFGFSDRFGVGITDLEDGTFELENSNSETEIWDEWTNGTTIQIPDITNLSRTYACYAEEFQWDDDTWKFNHNSTCENEYFLDADNNFAVFDYVFWHDYLSQYYHWSYNWEQLDDGTINNYVANSYFEIDGSPYIGNLTYDEEINQIVDIRLHDIQSEFDHDNHYSELLYNKTQKNIGAMGDVSDLLYLMDLSQVNWVSLTGKSTLSDLASPPDISIDEDIEWRISLCEVRNYVFYLETSRDIFGFRWVAFDPDFVQEEDEEESLTAEFREFSNWALDCENQFPFDFVWMAASYGGVFTPPSLEPINQSHQNTFYYNGNGIGITLLQNGTYQVDVIGWNGNLNTQYWTSNSSMPAFEIPTLETFSLQIPCYFNHFSNSLGSFNPSHGSCNENVLIDLSNPAGMIDHYYDDSQSYWWPFSSWINNYLWNNDSAWNGDIILENNITIISTNSSVQRDSDGQNDWSTHSIVLTREIVTVGSTSYQYITSSHDGSIKYIQGIETIGEIEQIPSIILPENYDWRISLCRLSASVGIYDAPYSIDGFRWVAVNNASYVIPQELITGCTDHFANNYNESATEDDDSCDYDLDNDGVLDADEVLGCTDPNANNHYDVATEENGSCDYDLDNDGILDIDEVAGCTDSIANNHHTTATDEDDSCDYDLDNDGVLDSDEIIGCNDQNANNFDYLATDTYDGSCDFDLDNDGIMDIDEIVGCTDSIANNYHATATEEDGSCYYDLDNDGIMDIDEVAGCTDSIANNHDRYPYANATDEDGSCDYDLDNDGVLDSDEVNGCTDDVAKNHDPASTEEDGSCEYESEEEVVLFDDLGSNKEALELVDTLPSFIIENSHPLTILAFTSFIGTAFIQAESLRYPLSKRFWWGMAFMIGATRKDHRGEFQRGKIIGVLATNQGIHLSALVRILGLGNHQAAHHLKVLEERGDIWHQSVGREVRFFTSDISKRTDIDNLPNIDISINENSVPYRILTILYENHDTLGREFTQKEIAQTLKSSKQLVSYHVRILEERRLIQRKRKGVVYRVAITTEGIRHILDDKHVEQSPIGIDQSMLFESIMNLSTD